MKRFLFLLGLISCFSFTPIPRAQAQYYGYGYGYYNYFPNFLYGYYGCLKGCGAAYTATTGIYLGIDALSYGLDLHAYTKAQEEQIQQMHYQAEAQRSLTNSQQRMIDFYNIQRVAPFFDNTTPDYTPKKDPQIKSFSKSGKELK